MKIALGGDSAGKPLIDVIEAYLKSKPGHEVTNLSQPGFYADLSATIAKAVKDGKYERAILCCGTGIGVSISANKVPGIRAALTHDTYSAERAAKSNNAQIITMGARVIGPNSPRPSSIPGWPRNLTPRRLRRQCRSHQPAG